MWVQLWETQLASMWAIPKATHWAPHWARMWAQLRGKQSGQQSAMMWAKQMALPKGRPWDCLLVQHLARLLAWTWVLPRATQWVLPLGQA